MTVSKIYFRCEVCYIALVIFIYVIILRSLHIEERPKHVIIPICFMAILHSRVKIPSIY